MVPQEKKSYQTSDVLSGVFLNMKDDPQSLSTTVVVIVFSPILSFRLTPTFCFPFFCLKLLMGLHYCYFELRLPRNTLDLLKIHAPPSLPLSLQATLTFLHPYTAQPNFAFRNSVFWRKSALNKGCLYPRTWVFRRLKTGVSLCLGVKIG